MNTFLTTLFTFLPLVSSSPISVSAPALISPRDSTQHGCTNTSFGKPEDFAFKVLGFDFHASYIFTTPAHQNSWGYASFNLSNPALAPTVATCSASSNQLSDFFYGTMIYTCALPDGTPVGGGSGGKATFDFARPSNVLNFNQSWTCTDQDPRWPITFNAYATANLTLDCQTTLWQNPNWTMGQIYSDRQIRCAPVDLTVKPYQMTAIA